jgi:prolyl-tRNA synthetase
MNDANTVETAEKLYNELTGKGIDVLLDDRDERAGVKFKDADLIGIPAQIIIGEKNLKDGLVEIKDRKTKEIQKVKVEEVMEKL